MSYPPQPPQQPPQPPQYQQPAQYQQGQYQQPYGQYQAPVQPKNSTMAIVGFVMALSCLLIMWIPGLNLLTLPLNLAAFIISIIGNNQVKNSHGMLTGKGFAVAGIVISSVLFGLFLVGVILIVLVGASLFGGLLGGL